LDSYKLYKGGEQKTKNRREASEHHTSGTVDLSRYTELHVSLTGEKKQKEKKKKRRKKLGSSGKNSRICGQTTALGVWHFSVLLTLRHSLSYQSS
jgi:hypothetical protein